MYAIVMVSNVNLDMYIFFIPPQADLIILSLTFYLFLSYPSPTLLILSPLWLSSELPPAMIQLAFSFHLH